MRVLVTGGTGFVGAHAVAALVRAGHDVRLLVRRPEQVPVSLNPLGVTVEDVLTGDVLDQADVTKALVGMEAVVHAAAVYSVDPRHAAEVTRTNRRAAELVLRGAADAGLDPVVHVSSTVALARREGSGPDLPLGDLEVPYARSKIDSEKVARELQAAGHPVVSVYPGAVFGPHDPYKGDQNERLRWVVRGTLPIWPKGGMHVVDVGDVARLLTAVLEPGRGPRRYVVPGHHMTGDDLFGALRRVTGRRLVHLPQPAAMVRPSTRLVDAVQKRLPDRWRVPADNEGVEIVLRDTRMYDEPARTEFGIVPRPLEETLADTVRWMVEAGRLRPRYAGDLVS